MIDQQIDELIQTMEGGYAQDYQLYNLVMALGGNPNALASMESGKHEMPLYVSLLLDRHRRMENQ